MDPLIGLGESKANGASASICYHAKNLDVVGRYQPGSLERIKMTVCASVLTAFAPLVESAVVETCRKETGPSMTPEERERMMYLCKRIQEEQDHAKFMELIVELNDLLARKEHRLEAKATARTD